MDFSLFGFINEHNSKMYIFGIEPGDKRTLLAEMSRSKGSEFMLMCNKVIGVAVTMSVVRPEWITAETIKGGKQC